MILAPFVQCLYLVLQSGQFRGPWSASEPDKSVLAMCIVQGMVPGVMPRKTDFVRARRFDLSKVVERWGGLYSLAEKLGYQVSCASMDTCEPTRLGCSEGAVRRQHVNYSRCCLISIGGATVKGQNGKTVVTKELGCKYTASWADVMQNG